MHVKHKGGRRSFRRTPAAEKRIAGKAAATEEVQKTQARRALQKMGLYIYPGPAGSSHWYKGGNQFASNLPAILRMFGPSDITIIHTGFSNVVVIDLDRHDPAKDGVENWKTIEAELHWPRTRVHGSKTNGGRHLIYRQNPELEVPSMTAVWDGIDIKAAGNHLIVAPPSPGRKVISSAPIATLPLWNAQFLIDAQESRRSERATNNLLAVSPGGNSEHSLGGILSRLSTAEEGSRNTILHWAACRVLELPATKQRMTMWNVRATAADIGLSDQEIDHTITSARRGGHRG